MFSSSLEPNTKANRAGMAVSLLRHAEKLFVFFSVDQSNCRPAKVNVCYLNFFHA